MVERRLDCENCRHLTVVGLHDTGPRTLPAILLTPPPSKAADMAHLCVPQNQALGVCRGFVPDIQVSGTDGREDLVHATITQNAEEEEEPKPAALEADCLPPGQPGGVLGTEESECCLFGSLSSSHLSCLGLRLS